MASQYMGNIISNYKKAWRICFLLGGLVFIPDMIVGEFRSWLVAVVCFIVAIAVVSRVRYSLKPNNLDSLLFFIDVTFISIVVLLFFIFFNALRTKNTYVILLDYYYIAILVVIGSLCYGVYFGLRHWPKNIKNTLTVMQNSTLTLNDLYNNFFDLPGVRTWYEGGVRKYMAYVGVAGVAMAGIFGGHQYVYLLIVIILMTIVPSMITSVLVRRIYYWKFFRRQVVQILDI